MLDTITASAPPALSSRLAAYIPDMRARALSNEAGGRFPEADIAVLRDLGAILAPLPIAMGGQGLGTSERGALEVMDVLRILGQGNLSLGRVYEAHVNAVRLVFRYGTPEQVLAMADAAAAGHLFGLWVTDAPGRPLELIEGRLTGVKAPCSAAGHVSQALVTARLPDGQTRMLFVPIDRHCRADRSGWDTHGMRGAANSAVAFDGLPVGDAHLLGAPGDYLRQPDFSAGAWRTSAVTLGGMEALVTAFRDNLVRRQRDAAPQQTARAGEALILQETARLWVQRAAVAGESETGDPADIVGIVNLARIAVETACLELIPLVQRGWGMAGFRTGEWAELLMRDLATYLRQPAPDETLADAATHFMRRDMAGVGPR